MLHRPLRARSLHLIEFWVDNATMLEMLTSRGAGGISAIGHCRLLEGMQAKVYKVSPEGTAFESAAA